MNFKQFEDEDNYYDDDFDNEFDTSKKNNNNKNSNLNGSLKKSQVKQNDWAAQNDNRNSLPIIETKKPVAKIDTQPKGVYSKIEPLQGLNSTTNQQQQQKPKQDGYQPTIIGAQKSFRASNIESSNNNSNNNLGGNILGSKPQIKSKSIVKPSENDYAQKGELNGTSKQINLTNMNSQPNLKANNQIATNLQQDSKNNNINGSNNLKPNQNNAHARNNNSVSLSNNNLTTNNNSNNNQKSLMFDNQRQQQNSMLHIGKSQQIESQPKTLTKGMKNVSSTPNLQSSSKRYQQTIIDAKQYLAAAQNVSPNFIQRNIEKYDKGEQSEFQILLDFIERTRTKIVEYSEQSKRNDMGTKSIEIDDSIKYTLNYDENMFLTTGIKELKERIDELFTKYDPKEQCKTRDREIENADKQLKALVQEYEKVYNRVEQVRNPTYLGDLHENLQDLDDQAKTLEKENKYKLISQQKRESTIEKIIQDGGPKIIYRIKELQDKLASVKEGIKRETTRKKRYAELMNNLTDQEYQLKDSEEKCLMIAKKNNIKFHDIEDLTPSLKKELESAKIRKQEFDDMDKQIKHTKLETNLTQKKAEMQEQQNKKRLKELKKKYLELKAAMAEASQQVSQKNLEINELQEKMNRNYKSKGDLFLDTDESGYKQNTQKKVQQPRGINYDAVQRAIEEMNQKETAAALVIQSNFRMRIAQKEFLKRLEIKKQQELQLRQIQERRRQEEMQKQRQQKQGANAQIGLDNNNQQQQQPKRMAADQSIGGGTNDSTGNNQQTQMQKIASRPNLMPKKRQ
ncbi:c2 domain containing protein [Stylonychia lemnae]|uniref:C2 domain containing protein n=1 Tax=Stylonychia lemnae TaxID=5949 RepID=A0A078AS31_STYLE|nr:c2 domain containing protein [Stylonychia lemnae]|eukprot:CDW85290.1 c2 domain containing protein [Stylonychia lemnae]